MPGKRIEFDGSSSDKVTLVPAHMVRVIVASPQSALNIPIALALTAKLET
jgi:hypothetical protein